MTRFHGVTLDEVRAGGTGLYEFTIRTGVPVRLHDVSLVSVSFDPAQRTLSMEFLYDDPTWTPAAARATPRAVFAFEDVQRAEVPPHAQQRGAHQKAVDRALLGRRSAADGLPTATLASG